MKVETKARVVHYMASKLGKKLEEDLAKVQASQEAQARQALKAMLDERVKLQGKLAAELTVLGLRPTMINGIRFRMDDTTPKHGFAYPNLSIRFLDRKGWFDSGNDPSGLDVRSEHCWDLAFEESIELVLSAEAEVRSDTNNGERRLWLEVKTSHARYLATQQLPWLETPCAEAFAHLFEACAYVRDQMLELTRTFSAIVKSCRSAKTLSQMWPELYPLLKEDRVYLPAIIDPIALDRLRSLSEPANNTDTAASPAA